MSQSENIVFGANPVLEKIEASAHEIVEILVAEAGASVARRKIVELAKRLGLKVVTVPAKSLDRLANGYRHQGVIARVEGYHYEPFEALLRPVAADGAPSWVLILDGITDPRNLGALLRTAEATGAKQVVIAKDRSVKVTPVVIKASAGAAHHVKISQVTNLRR